MCLTGAKKKTHHHANKILFHESKLKTSKSFVVLAECHTRVQICAS